MYVLRTGYPWRMSPKESPPRQTAHRYFSSWCDTGLWVSIGYRLMLEARKMEGRRTGPSAGIVGSQSVKTSESGGPRGFEPLLRRWVVERKLAWLSCPRRPGKDFEATTATAQAWIFIGNVQILTRRMART